MADFIEAFELMIAHEGGYVNDPDDPGGETYKGIARKINSGWLGWHIIDLLKRQSGFPASLDKNAELQDEIVNFYRVNYWDKVNGDQISSQKMAESIFDFGVNAGVATSVTLAQLVVGTTTDGVLGKNTVAKLNVFDPEHFLAAFTVAKIARYVSIVKKRPTSRKYFYGWILRALGE